MADGSNGRTKRQQRALERAIGTLNIGASSINRAMDLSAMASAAKMTSLFDQEQSKVSRSVAAFEATIVSMREQSKVSRSIAAFEATIASMREQSKVSRSVAAFEATIASMREQSKVSRSVAAFEATIASIRRGAAPAIPPSLMKPLDFPAPTPLPGLERMVEMNRRMVASLSEKCPAPPPLSAPLGRQFAQFEGIANPSLKIPQPDPSRRASNGAARSGIYVDNPEYASDDARALVLFALDAEGLRMVPNEFRKAYRYLDANAEQDLTGAITHAAGGLESLARYLTRDNKTPLDKLIKRHPDLFPWPVRLSIEAAWGYSSQYGRHVSESKVPTYALAEYVVNSTTSAALFLIRETNIGG